jgi:hypothetical protein
LRITDIIKRNKEIAKINRIINGEKESYNRHIYSGDFKDPYFEKISLEQLVEEYVNKLYFKEISNNVRDSNIELINELKNIDETFYSFSVNQQNQLIQNVILDCNNQNQCLLKIICGCQIIMSRNSRLLVNI